jgi:hypothetical protein
VVRKYADEGKKAKTLTKSKTAMGRMGSSSPSSPQLIDLLNRLVPGPATVPSDILARQSLETLLSSGTGHLRYCSRSVPKKTPKTNRLFVTIGAGV